MQLHPSDNVAVSLTGDPCGATFSGLGSGESVSAIETIPAGHKMAIATIDAQQIVYKFGLPIGLAARRILPGQHIHSQNLVTALADATYPVWRDPRSVPIADTRQTTDGLPSAARRFLGYLRPDQRAAVRNEIWIVNTVACVNQTANQLAAWANRTLVGKKANLDGVYAFSHPFGCSQLGDDLAATQAILAALAKHPHAAGVLLIGLGCENNQMAQQLAAIGALAQTKLRHFSTQAVGDEMEQGRIYLNELADPLSTQSRVELDAAKLIIGMKCGGSDGLSGITANPLLGRIADRHCAAGGTVLLTEVPEMFGAEAVLLGRCQTESIYHHTIQMIDRFKDYFRGHGQPISENPSPGNKDGGITTLEEKSLGCVQKGGTTSLIKQIVPYGHQADAGLGGIALVDGPGNDGVSTTALTAAGANVILFTTGRGTPLGGPAPTLKIATNSDLACNKPGWIDFDAGALAKGQVSLDQLADQLYDQILQVASGCLETKAELNGYREIAIWKTGVTL